MSHFVMDDNVRNLFRVQTLFIVSALILQSACTYLPSVPLTLHFKASAYLNPISDQHSLPVLIRIYQLSDAQAFQDATFNQLWRSARQALGNSFVAENQFSLYPLSQQRINITPRQRGHYIAVMAVFHNHSTREWRFIQPIPNKLKALMRSIQIRVEGNHLRVEAS